MGDYWFRCRSNGYYYVDYRDGKGWRSTKTKNEREALQWVQYHKPKPGDGLTFSDFASDFFLPDRCKWTQRMVGEKHRRFNPIYLSDHRARLVNHIMPRLGKYRLSEITPPVIDKELAGLKRLDGRGPLTAAAMDKVVETVRLILGEAVYLGILETNAANLVKPWHGQEKETKVFTLEEWGKLFPDDPTEIKRIWLTEMWATFYFLMGSCGLRPGEAAALRWGDWYRDLHGLAVKHNVEKLTRRIKGLKTEKQGVRERGAALTARAESMLMALSAGTESIDPEQLIFSVNGRAIEANAMNKHLRYALQRARVAGGRTAKSFRHTYVTAMMRETTLDKIKDAVGHTSDTMTRGVYAHPSDETLVAKAAALRDTQSRIFG